MGYASGTGEDSNIRRSASRSSGARNRCRPVRNALAALLFALVSLPVQAQNLNVTGKRVGPAASRNSQPTAAFAKPEHASLLTTGKPACANGKVWVARESGSHFRWNGESLKRGELIANVRAAAAEKKISCLLVQGSYDRSDYAALEKALVEPLQVSLYWNTSDDPSSEAGFGLPNFTPAPQGPRTCDNGTLTVRFRSGVKQNWELDGKSYDHEGFAEALDRVQRKSEYSCLDVLADCTDKKVMPRLLRTVSRVAHPSSFTWKLDPALYPDKNTKAPECET